jgi:hypothetical protein
MLTAVLFALLVGCALGWLMAALTDSIDWRATLRGLFTHRSRHDWQ